MAEELIPFNDLVHKNNVLYWQWMADTMRQPKTLEMLRKEIASLQVIQAKMEQGEL